MEKCIKEFKEGGWYDLIMLKKIHCCFYVKNEFQKIKKGAGIIGSTIVYSRWGDKRWALIYQRKRSRRHNTFKCCYRMVLHQSKLEKSLTFPWKAKTPQDILDHIWWSIFIIQAFLSWATHLRCFSFIMWFPSICFSYKEHVICYTYSTLLATPTKAF